MEWRGEPAPAAEDVHRRHGLGSWGGSVRMLTVAVMTAHAQAHLLFMVQIQLEHTMVIVGQMEQVISILNGKVVVLQQT